MSDKGGPVISLRKLFKPSRSSVRISIGTLVTENADGTKVWYRNGQLHREDGPAIEHADGGKSWYRNGQSHREDGPAVECATGDKYWFRNDLLHREDGPAVEHADGSKSWYRNGKQLTVEEFAATSAPPPLRFNFKL